MRQGAKNLDLNMLMQNVGAEQFDFGTFKAAYDTDARVKALVKNFNKEGVEPKTQKELEGGDDDINSGADSGKDTVGQMASRAVDLKDL